MKQSATIEAMTSADRERYSRQILFPAIGEAGQQKVLDSHAAIVGCGALGSFQAAALARAGIGRLTLIDRDFIEPSNLQRQWLFDEADAAAALPKALAAEKSLARINSRVRVTGAVADLTASNIDELLAEVDLILDGTDNFETRYLINDYSVSRGTPWIYGAAVRSIEMPARDPECPACGQGLFPYLDGESRAPISLCGRNAVQIHERSRPVDLQQLKSRLAPLGEVRANEFGLRFFCQPYEMTIFPDGRAIVKGTTDTGVARGLYARFVGA